FFKNLSHPLRRFGLQLLGSGAQLRGLVAAPLGLEKGAKERDRPLRDGRLQALAGQRVGSTQESFRLGQVRGAFRGALPALLQREAQLSFETAEMGLDEVLAVAGGGQALFNDRSSFVQAAVAQQEGGDLVAGPAALQLAVDALPALPEAVAAGE